GLFGRCRGDQRIADIGDIDIHIADRLPCMGIGPVMVMMTVLVGMAVLAVIVVMIMLRVLVAMIVVVVVLRMLLVMIVVVFGGFLAVFVTMVMTFVFFELDRLDALGHGDDVGLRARTLHEALHPALETETVDEHDFCLRHRFRIGRRR